MKQKNRKPLCLVGACLLSVAVWAQQDITQMNGYAHGYSPVDGYIVPEDEAVLKKLDQWQDLKFGVIFHWGVYAVPGITESWHLCAEDEAWEYSDRQQRGMSLEEYRRWYWGLSEVFNPFRFNPEQWADVMEDAGMKYVVFTTKHHDGFCMFDSQYTDYTIAKGPFASNPRKNVAMEVFDAFRAKDFMIGAYFSKPDWHCTDYWNPNFAADDRMQNYDRAKHPDMWERYVKFTQNQLTELTTDYGPLDILWLDGGQITGEEIRLEEVLDGARQRHPGLISVDRCERNRFENYQTPEGVVPPTQRNIPWETCKPMDGWGWKYNPHYSSSRAIIAMLIEVVAKGGNLLLGVGPTPDGLIDEVAQERLHTVGDWLRKNGKAIYNTRITPVYNDGKVWFNADKDGQTLYALYALGDDDTLPTTLQWTGNLPSGPMTLLSTGKKVKYSVRGETVIVQLPKVLQPESLALQFKVKR